MDPIVIMIIFVSKIDDYPGKNVYLKIDCKMSEDSLDYVEFSGRRFKYNFIKFYMRLKKV